MDTAPEWLLPCGPAKAITGCGAVKGIGGPMRRLVLSTLLLFSSLAAIGHAESSDGPGMTSEEFEAKLGYKTGTVSLPGGMATIRLPPTFRYLGPEGSRRLLTEGWDNPPGAADDVLGMLIPTAVSPLTEAGWGIVITYDDEGFVDDGDAAGINYNKLLKEMQESTAASNEERIKEGFSTITLVGWAEPPSYDAATHKLYWAKELAFGDSTTHTLNYNIRVLGRRGVLVLNAVAGIGQLASIKQEARSVMSAVEFSDGHRYTDYLPGTDKAATYGVTGLILGATAVKTGLLKGLWLGILAFKKMIIVGAVALFAALRKLFSGRGSASTTAESINPSQSDQPSS
jgi:uncharacterized membrane-anchored protein